MADQTIDDTAPTLTEVVQKTEVTSAPSRMLPTIAEIRELCRLYRIYSQRMARVREANARRSAKTLDPSKPKVFLSYRTSQHVVVARALRLALEDLGYLVWFDEDRGTLPSAVFYLDAWLEAALRSVDVVVRIAPRTETSEELAELNAEEWFWANLIRCFACWMAILPYFAQPDGSTPAWRTELDGLDEQERSQKIEQMLAFSGKMLRWSVPPELRAQWTKYVYDFDPRKLPSESWHTWEQRMATYHGTSVVTVGIDHGLEETMRSEDTTIAEDQIEAHVRDRLDPLLVGRHRRSGGPPLSPRMEQIRSRLERLWSKRRLFVVSGLGVVGLLGAAFVATGLGLLRRAKRRSARSKVSS